MNWKFRILNTVIMSIILSGIMTVYVTFINLGLAENFVSLWIKAWVLAAPAAFVCVLILATPVQKLTKRILG